MKPCFLPCFSLSWLGLYRMTRIGKPSGQVAVVCHGNVLFCPLCVTLGTVGLRTCESSLDEFSTQVHKVHLKHHIYGVLGFLSARNIWWKGDTIVQEEPLCTCFMDTTGHDTELCTLWTIQAFVSGNLCFLRRAWICTQFDHLVAILGLRTSVQRALNNTKMVLIFGCFAFLMCIYTEVDCYIDCY